MRKKIYDFIETNSENKFSGVYNILMMYLILVSLVPLMTIKYLPIFDYIELVISIVFIIDYLLRWITADYNLKKGSLSFVRYPFTFMSIVDLLSLLPTFIALNSGFRVFRLFRLARTLRIFRIFKVFKYSKNIELVINIFKKQRDYLLIVLVFALSYIFISALVIFSVEPQTFGTFFRAIYWATVSLTTMGYGDIYATTVIGQVITMASSIFGTAIIALPAGIVTAGYMEEVKKYKSELEQKQADEDNTPRT